jgi:parvulin-like peptidyl-prolyl isomerase
MSRPLLAAAVFGVSISILGCSGEPEARPLGADQFYRQNDQGGALPPEPTRLTRDPVTPRPQPVSPTAEASAIEDQAFVAGQVKPIQPADPATAPAPTVSAPAKPPEIPTNQFFNIGGVIAEVNGNPIYADTVFRTLTPILASRAKEQDKRTFQQTAVKEIQRQVDEMIRNEVEYASANRNTTAEEKKQANMATEAWRTRVITSHKGSIEAARAAFREQGRTFDEAAREQDRINLVRVYYSKKLLPRIQITAADMREFYEKNRDTLFTEKDNLTFRLIKIGIKETGSDAAAKAKIDGLAARAARGEDFREIAGSVNDPTLLKQAGLIGPIQRNAFVVEEVEKALWNLEAGQLTPVIKYQDAYYLAQLDNKKLGRTKAFEEDEVQRKMQESIRGEQFTAMRKEMEATLRKESVIAKNIDMYRNTLEMAMQNYDTWKSE